MAGKLRSAVQSLLLCMLLTQEWEYISVLFVTEVEELVYRTHLVRAAQPYIASF